MYIRKVPFFGTFKLFENRIHQAFKQFVRFNDGYFTNFSIPFLSGRRVSNPQPPAWKAGALPIELLPLTLFYNATTIACGGDRRIRTSEAFATDLQSVPFGHSGISPFIKKEPKKGLEPPTY